MHNTFDFADPSARGGRRGRQLSLRVIKRAKKEKRRREEREKKEVGHERMVIKRIAVISLPVALTFASVDEFNRYHFAWKRASERASEQAASAAGGNGNTYAPLLNACKSLTIQSKRGRDRSFQPPVYTCLALMREARIPFSFLHNKRISYRGVTRDFSRERERVFAPGNLAPRASWKQGNGQIGGSRRGGRIIGFKAGTIEKKNGWTDV